MAIPYHCPMLTGAFECIPRKYLYIPLNFNITAPSALPSASNMTEDVTEKSKCSLNITLNAE